MDSSTRAVPRSLVFFALTVLLLGLCAQFLSLIVLPLPWSPGLLLLVAAAVLSENYALRLENYSVSLSFPMVIAAIALGGPSAGGLVAGASFTNIDDVRAKRPWVYSVFNLGQVLVAASIGGWVYAWFGGVSVTSLSGLPGTASYDLILSILGAGAAYSVANTLLTGVAIHLVQAVPLRSVLGSFAEYVPTQLALCFVGLLVAQVVVISPWGLPLFLFPLFLARQVYQRYAAMRDVYVDTVRSLVGALEAKDPYTRGHSERVAMYAVALGRRLALDERHLDILEKSALLHDIGKLAIASEVLTKPCRLSEAEFAMMRQHPEDGAAMVERIPPLRGLRDLVMGHHERYDGSGYPLGLSSTAIPQLSRMLAIADAFDAMTTDRSYRRAMSHEAALREIVGGAGTQFDPHLVSLFAEQIRMSSNSPDLSSGQPPYVEGL